jgi:hypothetical protein
MSKKEHGIGMYTVDVYNGKNIISSITTKADSDKVAKAIAEKKISYKISRYQGLNKDVRD